MLEKKCVATVSNLVTTHADECLRLGLALPLALAHTRASSQTHTRIRTRTRMLAFALALAYMHTHGKHTPRKGRSEIWFIWYKIMSLFEENCMLLKNDWNPISLQERASKETMYPQKRQTCEHIVPVQISNNIQLRK